MRYIAFLRAINVGGNNIVKLGRLRKFFEGEGFINVETFIGSGNVIFDGAELRALARTMRSRPPPSREPRGSASHFWRSRSTRKERRR